MQIPVMSALERSRAGDRALGLGAAPEAEKREMWKAEERSTPAGVTQVRGAGGSEESGLVRSGRRAPVDDVGANAGSFMSDESFFNEETGDDWAPAKSGADIATEGTLAD